MQFSQLDSTDDLAEDQRCISKLADSKKGISKIRRVCCIPIDNGWSMKSQITIASIIIFFTIFFFLVSITSYNIAQVGQIMQNSQDQLYVNQALKQLNIVSRRFKRLVSTHFQAVHDDSKHFQKLFSLVVSNGKKTSNFLDTPFVQNQSIFQNYKYTWVCYATFVNQSDTKMNDLENKFFIQSIQHFNQIYPLIINQNYTFLVTHVYTGFWTQEQILYLHPPSQLDSTYRPQQRSWYTEMQQVDSTDRNLKNIFTGFHTSQPFFSYTNNATTMAISKTLLGKSFQFKGVIASSIDLSRFSKLFQTIFASYTTLLVNYDGNLLISPYFDQSLNGNSLHLLFSNVTITGFDQDDWLQVANLALNKQIIHNCSIPYLDQADHLLCRWNKVKKRNQLIFADQMKGYNYYIVIILDQEQLFQQFFIEKQKIQDNIVQTSIIHFGLICMVFLILLVLVLIAITIIFRPLRNITDYCQQINDKDLMKINKVQNNYQNQKDIVVSGVFHPLTKSFYNLVRQSSKLTIQRNMMCDEIEHLEYPQQIIKDLDIDNNLFLLNDMDLLVDFTTKWSGRPQLQRQDKYQMKQGFQTIGMVSLTQKQNQRQKKYLEKIQSQLLQSGQLKQKNLIQLIFQFYKKF